MQGLQGASYTKLGRLHVLLDKDMQDDHLHFLTAEGPRCGLVKAKAAKCPAEQTTAATQLSDYP